MAHMDRWTHPALHRVALTDPMLNDGLDGLGDMGIWQEIVGFGLDFLDKKNQLDAQKDQLKAQMAAAQTAKEVAQLQLQAAQAQKAAAIAKAEADAKAVATRQTTFGLDVSKFILPIAIGGGAILLFMLTMKKRKK